jgi:hypothetical protein
MNRKMKSYLIPLVCLSVLTVGLYIHSLNNHFFFDDLPNIVENPYTRNPMDIPLFLKGLGTHQSWFRILPTYSFALNYHVHQLNVFGYHLVNLILHLLSGFLVYFIARDLFRLTLHKKENSIDKSSDFEDKKIVFLSLFTAMIFIAHPIQVNTVAYIVQRNEGMSAFFYLLGFFLFIKGALNKGIKRWLCLTGTGFSFLGSIFSKEIGFTLPLILALFDFLFLCKTGEDIIKRLKIYLPLLLGVTVYIAFFLRGGLLYQFMGRAEGWRWTPWENLLTQSNVILQYMKLLFLPLPGWLNIDHDFPVSRSLFEYPTYISAALIVLLLFLALFLIRKNRLVSFSILWFFVVLAPTSSVIPIWDIMVEYRLYLPLLSYAFLLGLAVHYLFNVFRKFLSLKLSLGVVLGLSCLPLIFYSHVTLHRNDVFKDELTVWSDTAKKSPQKMRVRHNLGRAYFNRGLIDDAIREGEIALELSAHIKNKTNVKFVLNLLGGGYFRKGENEKALDLFQRAAEIDPQFATAYYNMSCVYANQNEKEKALKYLKQGISLHRIYKEKARGDRDFELLRGDKDFEKLLE